MRRQPQWRRPLALLVVAALLTGLTLSFPAPVSAAGEMEITAVEVTGSPGVRSASTVGGTRISIFGDNLLGVTQVLINGRQATGVTVISAMQVTALTPPAGLADVGKATVTVVRGNESATLPSSALTTFEYIASAPQIIGALAPDKGSLLGGEQVTINGADFHPEAEVYFDNVPAWQVTWKNAGQLVVTAPPRAELGTVDVRVSNPDGGEAVATYEYVIVPRITSITPNWARPGGNVEVLITGSNFPPAAQVKFGNANAAVTASDPNGEWLRVTVPPGQGGACVTVAVLGTSGVWGTLPNAFCYMLSFDAPIITGVTPSQGGLAGGDIVTVEGSGFVTGARVFFGQGATQREAFVRNVWPNRIEVETPPHAAGDVRVTVRNPDVEGTPGDEGFLDNAYRYAIPEDMLLITSVTPNEGPVSGGTRVLIHGVNLKSLADYDVDITFGGISAGPVTAVPGPDGRPSAYEVTVPPGGALDGEFQPPQPVDIAVLVTPKPHNVDGRSERAVLRDGFRYTLPPSQPKLTEVEQTDRPGYNRGPAASPFSVTLTGTDFRAPAKVWFNDMQATDVTVHEGGTKITAIAPRMGQPTVAHVRVENPDGASDTLFAAFFFDGNTMQLYSIAPTEGSTLGGTEVTLIGANLDVDWMEHEPDRDRQNRYTWVTIGGLPAVVTEITPGTPGNPSRVKVIVPTHTAGRKDVILGNRYGDTRLPQAFTYFQETSQPTIDAVCMWDEAMPPGCLVGEPLEGPSTGGTWVMVTGTQFYTGVDVLFGGVPASEVRHLSDTRVLARTNKTPPGLATIAVVNRDGGRAELADAFLVLSTPQVLGATPAIVDHRGGTIVTLLGDEFLDGITVTFNGKPALDTLYLDSQRVRVRVPDTDPGPVTVEVTNTDGRSAAAAVLTSVESVRNPYIDTVTPNDGTHLGGEDIWLEGGDFAPAGRVAVWFGLESATVRSVTDGSHITAVSPPAPGPGVVDVTIVNLDDGSTAVMANGFEYRQTVSTPVLTRVTPAIGDVTGGDTVTLHGSDFIGTPTVHFGTQEAVVESASADRLVVTTPAGSLGTVDILVTNPDGARARLRNGFQYLSPGSNPVIDSIDPDFGTLAGGTDIRITGSDFRAPVYVYVDGEPATNVTVVPGIDGAPDVIRAKTPPGRKPNVPVNVTVVNFDGAAVTAVDAFTYVIAGSHPHIDAITPSLGPIVGGTLVTIQGRDFRGDPADETTWPVVYFDGNPAHVVELRNHAELVVETPPGRSGAVSVTVTNRDGGTVTRQNAFTYGQVQGTIRLTAVVPNFGPVSGGNWVTLVGVDFDPAVRVYVRGTLVPARDADDEPQVIVAPDGKSIDVRMPPSFNPDNSPRLGPVDIEVRNPDGTSAVLQNGYTYMHPDSSPTVTDAQPQTVSSRGGDFMTVTGSDFRQGIRVYFGGVPAAAVTRVSDTTLIVTTPAHPAGEARLTVINEDGGTASLDDPITFKDPLSNPEITKLTPDEGHVSGGTAIVVEGKDFRHSAAEPIEVWFGTVQATVTFESYERLLVISPPAENPEGGPVDVTVINRRDGDVATFTLKNGFRYTTHVPPSPPTGPLTLTAAAASDRIIVLEWNALSGVLYYQIEAATSIDGPWRPAGQAADTAWYATGLSPETLYYFRVRAVNALGTSDYSNVASARTLKTGASLPVRSETHAAVGGGQALFVLESRDALYRMAGYVPLGYPPYDRYARKELKLGSGLVNDFAYVTVDFGDLGLVIPTWAMRFEELRYRSTQPFTDAYARLIAQRLEGQAHEAAMRTLPAGVRPLSPVYDFTLGSQLGRAEQTAAAWLLPVQLSVPLPAAHWHTPSEKLQLLRFDPVKRAWEPVPTGIWYRQVTAEVTLAGRYVLVVKP